MFFPNRFRTPLSIAFAFVATHNHFVLDRGGKVFNRSAPVIKLSAGASEDDHLALLGLLNSSTACFWLKQVCHNKGSTVDQQGARQRTAPFEDFYAFNGTKVKEFPLAEPYPTDLARRLDALAQELSACLPAALCARETPTRAALDAARERAVGIRRRMIALQEELDWRCYGLYGILPEMAGAGDGPMGTLRFAHPTEPMETDEPPEIDLGERAFEIVLARRMAAGELETAWFTRHGSTPITGIPERWPEDYRRLVERRIALIESDRNIGLVERPEYKRRWSWTPWAEQEREALKDWLLDRIETHFSGGESATPPEQ